MLLHRKNSVASVLLTTIAALAIGTAHAKEAGPTDADQLRSLLDSKPFRLSLTQSSASRQFDFTVRFEADAEAVRKSNAPAPFGPTLTRVAGDNNLAAILVSTSDGLPFCLLVKGLIVICDPTHPGGLAYYDGGVPRWELRPGSGESYVYFDLGFDTTGTDPIIDLNLGGIIQNLINKGVAVAQNESGRTWTLFWNKKRSSLEVKLADEKRAGPFPAETIWVRSRNSSMTISDIRTEPSSLEGLFDISLTDLQKLGLPLRALAKADLRRLAPVVPAEFPREGKEREAAKKLQDWIALREKTVDTKSATAFRAIKARAEAGDAQAQYNLALMYLKGDGVAQNFREAAAWLKKSAEQNFADAQFNLGVCYHEGKGVPQDDGKALAWYRKAADQNQPEATINLGVMYFRGRGVPREDSEAFKLFRKAADLGSTRGFCYLSLMYANGRGTNLDPVEANKWYQKAAERGNAWAQTILAKQYDDGTGVIANADESLRWYKKAAAQNYPPAQSAIGIKYVMGRGVEQNYENAAQWLSKAAEAGYAEAQYGLAVLYKFGNGVRQSDSEAMKWFERAANQGYSKAQLHLGVSIAEKGDVIEAYKWLALADGQAEKQAGELLAKLAKELGPEKISEGKRRVAAFVPKIVFDLEIPE